MCLMLYLATAQEIPLQQSPDISVEEVEPSRAIVLHRFSCKRSIFTSGFCCG